MKTYIRKDNQGNIQAIVEVTGSVYIEMENDVDITDDNNIEDIKTNTNKYKVISSKEEGSIFIKNIDEI